jgi:hypothetical protein
MLAADHAVYYAACRRRVCPNEQLFSSAIRPPGRQDYGAGAAAVGRHPGELSINYCLKKHLCPFMNPRRRDDK